MVLKPGATMGQWGRETVADDADPVWTLDQVGSGRIQEWQQAGVVVAAIENDGTFTALGGVAIDLGDDDYIAWGTDDDDVIAHTSAGVAADTALANVLVDGGGIDTPATAADSLIVSGVTANADILFAVNNGGDSFGMLLLDASTKRLTAWRPVDFGNGIAIEAGQYQVGRNADGTNVLQLNVPTGATFEFSVNDVSEVTLSATSLGMGSNTIDAVGDIKTTNAAGPAILNEAATTTNPTLIPDRAEDDTGIGWATDELTVVLGGADEYRFSTSRMVMGAGEGSATAVTGNVIRAPDMVGGTTVDAAGADLTFSAGLGTGNGDVGTLIFQLPDQNGASNNTLQDRATRLTMDMVASTTVLSMTFAQAVTFTTAAGDLALNPNGNVVLSNNSLTEIGNSGSQLLADAWTMVSANAQALLIETTGAAINSQIKIKIPAAGTGAAYINFTQGDGNGTADHMQYQIGYDGNSAIFYLLSADSGTVFQVADGTNDVAFQGGISTDGAAAPTGGINVPDGNGLLIGEEATNYRGVTSGFRVATAEDNNRTAMFTYYKADDTLGFILALAKSQSDVQGTLVHPGADSILGQLVFAGAHVGRARFEPGVVIQGVATELWDATGSGTKLELYTTDNGSLTNDLRWIIDQDGSLLHGSGPGIDLNSSGTILNIGAAGNDFGATQLDLAASFTILGANDLTVQTTVGDINISAATGSDVLIGDDTTILYVDGGLSNVGIGISPITTSPGGSGLVVGGLVMFPSITTAGIGFNAVNTVGSYAIHVPASGAFPIRVVMHNDGSTKRPFEVGYYDNNDRTDTWNTTLKVTPIDTLVRVFGVLEVAGVLESESTLVMGASDGATGAHTGQTIRAPDHPGGTDTDSAGADLTLAAGLGTGNGDAGTVIVQLPDINGASNNTQQSRQTVMTLDMVASQTVATMTLDVNWIVNGTWDDIGIITTGDINGGTIDGATIGGDVAAAITGTTITLTERLLEKQGADVGSTNNLVLGTDGNVFEITGTTDINLISNISWQNGSTIILLFTSTATVKDAQATSSTNITILLDGSADFVPSAGDTLQLTLCEIGGTQAWRESGGRIVL